MDSRLRGNDINCILAVIPAKAGIHTAYPNTNAGLGGIARATARDPMNAPAPGRIPVTLIGGYLGAGKTSLLNHLLTHAGGERIAVLVNDFGALGLDAALVARRDADTVTLTNGCVCCTIADDFGAALDAQVRAGEPPERIVVETSGVAEPAKTARYASGWPGVRLDAVLTVVDLETIRARAKDRFVGDLVVRQIESADLIVANKSDRVDASTRRSAAQWLARRAPRAARVETSHGQVAPAVVLGVDLRESGGFGEGAGDGRIRSRPPNAPVSPACEPSGPMEPEIRAATGHDALPPFVRVSCRAGDPLDRAALVTALDALPSVVVRFKGVVRLREHPERPYVLQGVGRRWSLEPAPPHVPAALGIGDGSAIDLIGVGPAGPIERAARKIAPVP